MEQTLASSIRGEISKDDANKVVKEKLEQKTILFTDGHYSFKVFSKVNKLEH